MTGSTRMMIWLGVAGIWFHGLAMALPWLMPLAHAQSGGGWPTIQIVQPNEGSNPSIGRQYLGSSSEVPLYVQNVGCR